MTKRRNRISKQKAKTVLEGLTGRHGDSAAAREVEIPASVLGLLASVGNILTGSTVK